MGKIVDEPTVKIGKRRHYKLDADVYHLDLHLNYTITDIEREAVGPTRSLEQAIGHYMIERIINDAKALRELPIEIMDEVST